MDSDAREYIINKVAFARISDKEEPSPRQLAYALLEEENLGVKERDVREFLQKDEVQRKIEDRKDYINDELDYQLEELKHDLIRLKKQVQEANEDLIDNPGKITPEMVNAQSRILENLGELIGELKQHSEETNQSIRVDNLEITTVINNLPDEKKEEVVRDLTDEVGLVVKEKKDEDDD